MTGLVWTAFGVRGAAAGLADLRGRHERPAQAINVEFLTYSMRGVTGDEQGGVYHALIGTLLITLAATLISVPIGVLTAIYLVEYGGKSRLARWITFLVDVMTGIPSIVAGLFALALFVLIFGPAYRMGFGGSIALSLLMIPTVVRSSEEMFRLVPMDLREASYALGVPKWRTILKVVLPDRDRRRHHRRGARDLAGDRRDRAAAGRRRRDRRRELQPVRRPDDHAPGLHLLAVRPVHPRRLRARLGRRAGPDRDRDGAQPHRARRSASSSLPRKPEGTPWPRASTSPTSTSTTATSSPSRASP